jgi:hypothetical protein
VLPLAADELVERTGPDPRVRWELECSVASGEEERLKIGILRWGDSKKLRCPLDDRACRTKVAAKRVYKKRVFRAMDPGI